VRHATLELLAGAAGHAVFLVRLWRATRKKDYLEDALRIGERLLDAQCRVADGGACWPPVGSSDQGRASLGLAHGAAGIAFALLELSEASGDARMSSVAAEVGDLLMAKARPHPDGGWDWAETLDGAQTRVQAQCHGAIGIGQLFVRLARLRPGGGFAHAAGQAALTAHREMARRPSHALCHGLAGDGMLLVECARLLDEPRYGDWARECGDQLMRFHDKTQPGRYVSADGGPARPDLLTGDAGVGWFYLALANSEHAADPVLGPWPGVKFGCGDTEMT
jgi:lantibiotic modifying enzyme